jgi:spore coat protein U-like protein
VSGLPKTVALLAGAACALAATPALAGGRLTTGTLPVSLKIATSCSLSTNPLMFGSPPSKQTTATATTTLEIKCPPGTAYSVAIDQGLNYNNGRRMFNPQAQGQVFYAAYEVYSDAAMKLRWGSAAGETVSGTVPAGGLRVLTMYGAATLKNLRPGPYHDTLTVVVNF